MDIDNEINEVIETRQLRSGTPLGRTRVDTPTRRRSMRARNQASSEKAEKSTTITTVTESRTTEVNYVGGTKSRSEREASVDLSDNEKKRESSSHSSYSRRTVLNGASVDEDDTDVIVLDENEPQTVTTTTKTSVIESGYSSDEGNKTRLRAYDIYKSAGEYWEVYPKTDYTYSRSSTDRKEISPGVINPPNMSRRSLHPRTIPSISDIRKTSPTSLLVTKRDVKSEVTSRYFSDRKSDGYVSEKLKRWAAVDSDVDEVDEKISAQRTSKSAASSSSLKSVLVTKFVTVWTYLTSFVLLIRERVRRLLRRENYLEEVHYSSMGLESERETSWQKFRGSMLYWATCFQTWVVAWLLYWLHGGHGHVTTEDRRRRKYYQLFLLGLLPLLILLGGGLISYMKKSSLDNMNLVLDKFSAVTERWLHVSHFDSGDEDSHQRAEKSMPHVTFSSIDENLIVQKVLNSLELQRMFQAQKDMESEQTELKGRFDGLKLDGDMRLKAALYDEQAEQIKRLTAEVDRLKMQIDAFNIQQRRMKESQDYTQTEFNFWQKKIRDLNARLRLQQEALYQTVNKMEKCCKQEHPVLTAVDIEKHVIKFLSGLFSSEEEAINSVPEIRGWIQKLFVAKDELEARLANVSQKVSVEAANRSAEIIMTSVSDIIKEEFIRQHQDGLISSHYTDITSHSDADGLSYSKVQKIVDEALAKYDADKTGMVDYALESSGGSILSTRCTENYQAKTAMLTVLGWFHWYPSGASPRTVIQTGAVPGNCWAFSGQGFLVIQLSTWIKITAFSIEHIPRSLSPAGKLDSAPRDFRVLGLKHENDNFPMEIGKYQYQENGTSLQFFKVQRLDLPPFNIVELQIESNHGNKEYTCLYRFRVHGTRVPEKDLGR